MPSSTFPSDKIRNVALLGHGFSGKTSLAEAMLFLSGATSRLGVAGSPSSTLDFEPEEHKRGGSINSSFAWFEHEGVKVNVIDTPGDANFVYDAFAALRGADAAVIVISGPDGVEVQTERLFYAAGELGLPRVLVINKMDRERADARATLKEIEEVLGVKPVPLNLPIGAEDTFTGVVSLFQRKGLVYERDGSGRYVKGDIPANLQDDAQVAIDALVEVVAASDDALLEKYLDTFELSDAEVRQGFHNALKQGRVLPVIFTSATRNIGVHALMDLLQWAAPSPLERAAPAAIDSNGDALDWVASPDGAFVAQIIRTQIDEHAGKASVLRLFSGQVPADGQVVNSSSGESERLGSLFALRGLGRETVERGVFGDIVGVAKLKGSRTNDTLVNPGERLRLEGVTYPAPMMDYTLQPVGRADEDKLKTAVERLMDEDPSLRIGYDDLSKRLVLRGMGQAHLDLAVDKLRRKFKVDVTTDLPAVPYRETIRRKVTSIEGKHKKQTGGAGQFGVCILDVEPLARGAGFEFADEIFGGSIPRQYIPSVEKGVRRRMEAGPLAGYPVVDLRVALKDGKYHPVDSKDVAFQMAGSKGLAAAMQKGGVKLLEPIYKLEVIVPSETMGDVMGDITGRRGRVLGIDTRGRNTVVQAAVPLAEILRYAPTLRSLTGGKGVYTAGFEGYEDVPTNLVDKIVADSPFRRADDDDE